MAGQGILPSGPREPRWWIQDSATGEHVFAKCPQCGGTTGPHHKVIRMSDADLRRDS